MKCTDRSIALKKRILAHIFFYFLYLGNIYLRCSVFHAHYKYFFFYQLSWYHKASTTMFKDRNGTRTGMQSDIPRIRGTTTSSNDCRIASFVFVMSSRTALASHISQWRILTQTCMKLNFMFFCLFFCETVLAPTLHFLTSFVKCDTVQDSLHN